VTLIGSRGFSFVRPKNEPKFSSEPLIPSDKQPSPWRSIGKVSYSGSSTGGHDRGEYLFMVSWFLGGEKEKYLGFLPGMLTLQAFLPQGPDQPGGFKM